MAVLKNSFFSIFCSQSSLIFGDGEYVYWDVKAFLHNKTLDNIAVLKDEGSKKWEDNSIFGEEQFLSLALRKKWNIHFHRKITGVAQRS